MTNDLVLHRRLASAVVAITLSACGGDGDAATRALAATPAPAAANKFNSAASLKTSNAVLYDGKTYGMARALFQVKVDQCNGFRKMVYNLGPISPSDATLASIDVSVHEKYIDTNKALTVITSNFLVLTDMRRWLDEAPAASKAGGYPALPMDCSVVSVTKLRSGTLWRDGLKYDLRYDTQKAIGNKASTVPMAFVATDMFLSFSLGNQAGQTCREVVGVADLSPDNHACIWDIFPYVRYLNWPFALSGRVQFGPRLGPGATQFETITPLAADQGKAIDPSVFEIPAGFTVRVPK